ncbi:glycosyltransferase [Deinococcus ficus]|uniref:glycosyltransferase n=1 Tax=Deinococcus ficus TaxID=317577 RepID=UPI0003B343FC|nr:glycosyltransferase [Deinococcus ficus]
MDKLTRETAGAIVVCYDTGEAFGERLRKMHQLAQHVAVIINRFSSDEQQQAFTQQLRLEFSAAMADGIRLVELEQNYGIGVALNRGVEALPDDAEWLIFFDDDTTLFDDVAGVVAEEVARALTETGGGASFGQLGLGYAASSGEQSIPGNTIRVEKLAVITSGSILHRSTYRQAGPFREDLFIDSIDIEYSLRLRRMGRKVLKSSAAFMTHPLGRMYQVRLLGHTLQMHEHNALRCYYIVRNRILVGREYFNFSPIFFFFSMVQILLHVLRVMVFERQKLLKLSRMFQGAVHGISGRTGRLTVGAQR